MVVYETGSRSSPDTESASTMVLDFSVYSTLRNKFLWLLSHPIYGIFYSSLNRLSQTEISTEGGTKPIYSSVSLA